MTFVVAWKRNGIAYLCADSAYTTEHAAPFPAADSTTFGEREINVEGRQVRETALKLINMGPAIAAICGRSGIAQRVLIALKAHLIHNADLRSALVEAIAESVTPEEAGLVHLVVAAPSDSEVAAFVFNANNEGLIEPLENDVVFCLGSMPSQYRKMTATGVVKAANAMDVPSRHLASVLSMLQSYGVNQNLLEHGVGGTYCGAYVTGFEIKWQEDINYIFVQPGAYLISMVSTSVRENVVIARSELTQQIVVRANSLSGGLDAEWMAKWRPHLLERVMLGAYQYVTFLTAGLPNCTVVEMGKHSASGDLIMPTREDLLAVTETRIVDFTISPRLKSAITAHASNSDGVGIPTMTFFEYTPPPDSPPDAVPFA
jgi:hypothetical protein